MATISTDWPHKPQLRLEIESPLGALPGGVVHVLGGLWEGIGSQVSTKKVLCMIEVMAVYPMILVFPLILVSSIRHFNFQE